MVKDIPINEIILRKYERPYGINRRDLIKKMKDEKNQEETDQQIRLDWRWIDLRKPEKALIFKVWTVMEQAFRNYCIENGFVEIHSPKLTAMATESGSELFEVKYFKIVNAC